MKVQDRGFRKETGRQWSEGKIQPDVYEGLRHRDEAKRNREGAGLCTRAQGTFLVVMRLRETPVPIPNTMVKP